MFLKLITRSAIVAGLSITVTLPFGTSVAAGAAAPGGSLTTPAEAASPVADVAPLQVYDLTCEQLDHPIGLTAAAPRFSWKLHSTRRGVMQAAYQLMVGTDADFPDAASTSVWSSGKVRSDASVLVPYAGVALQPSTRYFWRVRVWDADGVCSDWSEPATFATGLMQSADWGKARWIAMQPDDRRVVPAVHRPLVKKTFKDEQIGMYVLPQFRKVIRVEKPVRQAWLYICGLGQFECFLNGTKVGDHFLDPAWTQYDKEARYVTFDVTHSLRQGGNVVGVMLGNGFYNIPRERYFKLLGSYGAPKLKLMLQIEYADGSRRQVVTDKSWRVAASAVTYSGIYGGEDYDATREQEGWSTDAAFDDRKWQKALEVEQNIVLKSQTGSEVTVRQEMPVVSRFKNVKGQWVYDLGQNFSGIVRVTVQGRRGQSLLLRPAELIHADKTVNQKATGSPFYFKYTLRGGDEPETWQPQFTYYGFRYVQLEGCVPAGSENPDSLPEVRAFVGLHTSNGAARAGSFHCSKPMFNQILTLIDWAVSSNMSGVLTDCPHREKLGWLEQVHLMQYALLYGYDLSAFYAKIMDDMAAAQTDAGVVPTIAPEYVRFDGGFEDTPEWGSAFIISPWYHYLWYGDTRLIARHYEAMKRYLRYLGTRADGHIVAYGLGDWYDLGPNLPGYAQLTTNGVTATAIYYYNTTLMAKMAGLLGQAADSVAFGSLADSIRTAYNATYFHADSAYYDRNSQAANAISLYMNLVPESQREAVLANLVADIRGRDNALTAGDVGYRYLLQALEENDRADVIYDMNCKYDVPGYGWQLAHGATALTESWQAYARVSNNHLMLGHLQEWLYGGLGGIRQTAGSVAFKTVLIDPQVVGDVTTAATTYESPYGRIVCEWEKTESDYSLRVTIPANSRAVVVLPATDSERITEYGVPIDRQRGITRMQSDDSKSRWVVGSGSYLFHVRLD